MAFKTKELYGQAGHLPSREFISMSRSKVPAAECRIFYLHTGLRVNRRLHNATMAGAEQVGGTNENCLIFTDRYAGEGEKWTACLPSRLP